VNDTKDAIASKKKPAKTDAEKKLEAKYKKKSFSEKKRASDKKSAANQKSKVVYIGNLNYKMTEENLQGIFSKYGKVKSVKLVTKQGTEQSQGIAFVRMGNGADADKAIKLLDGREIDGRKVKVSEAIENESSPKKSFDGAYKKKKEKQEDLSPKRKVRRGGLNELFRNTGK
jgi:RNA recognition motif-containing protein